jgi:hypothetical protein
MAEAPRNQEYEERLAACVDLARRTGSMTFELRYSDDQEPIVWMAIGKWGENYETAAAMNPLRAAVRLLEIVIDGGTCTHCERLSGVSDDWSQSMPLESHVCWYVYDPETKKFRRGCEGDK